MTMNSAETSSEKHAEEAIGVRKSCELKQVNNVLLKPNITTISKRASFHFKPSRDDSGSNRINNKVAYLKLQHRHSFSPGSNVAVQKLKEKYEIADLEKNNCSNIKEPIDEVGICSNRIVKVTKLTPDSIDQLREKYSPKSFGYPKTKLVSPSKIPVPTPRNSLTNQVVTVDKRKNHEPTLETIKVATIDRRKNLKTAIITEVTPSNFEEVQLVYSHIEFAKPEARHFVVSRSSSEDSVLKVESSLADFVMEKKPKEKKRSSSFRRILSGGLFGRDKKKPEEDRNKSKKKDNVVFADNAQNESQVFDRYATHRHTVDSSYPRRSVQKPNVQQNNSGPLYYYKPQQNYVNTAGSRNVDNRYTDMHGTNIVPPQVSREDYVHMDNRRQANYLNVNKFIDNSSSSSNTDSDSRNCTYQNALIAQAELRHIRENENRTITDSSSSTETFRSTPPRNQKTFKNLELVKPKAIIPINSERPLPNPYHTCNENVSKTIERNLDVDSSKPFPNKRNFSERMKSPVNPVVIDDTYGTVFDSITLDTKCSSPNSPSQISPRSLEASKLKLPSNREKIELQPRIRSPIPQTKVSTDKIIATELLRNRGSPMGSIERQHTSRSSRQEIKLPNGHSTPPSTSNEYIHLNTVSSYAAAKPPLSPRDNLRTKRHVTLATVHADASDRSGVVRQRNTSSLPPKPSNFLETVPVRTNASYMMQNQGRYGNLYETRFIQSGRQSPSSSNERMGFSPNARFQPQLHDQRDSLISDTSYATLQHIESVRPRTPIGQRLVVQPQKSPEKQHMIQNVEAYYWRELKKLKEQEEHDLLNYRQQQFYVYGYAEDPVFVRRSRSVSPTMQRGRRSFSLPRSGPETIIEARPILDKRPGNSNEFGYGQNFQRNPNFVRNTFERTTIGPIGMNRYYEQPKQNSTPIFRRGSLTPSVNNEPQFQTNKKVSFSNTSYPNNLTSWPTKNGFTQSPPTRRIERVSLDDDVFLANSPRARRSENIYMNDSDPTLSRTEPLYESAFTKHVTVSDKVCDIYGQIHDSNRQPIPVSPQNYGQIRQVGLVYGQLQQRSPVVLRQSFDHLNSPQQPNFIRGTRLTASVNDMYRRYPNRVEFVRNPMQPPNRPLPPVPERRDSRSILTKKIHGHLHLSDTESGSEAAEVQRILYLGTKQKNFGAIGK